MGMSNAKRVCSQNRRPKAMAISTPIPIRCFIGPRTGESYAYGGQKGAHQALQANTALQTFFDGPALIVFHNTGLVRAECGHSRDQWTRRKLILSTRSFCLFCGTVDFKRILVPSTVLDEFGC